MSSYNSRTAVASGSLYRTSSRRIPPNQEELYSSSDEYLASLEAEKNELYNKYFDMYNEIIGTIEKNNSHLISIIENNNKLLHNKIAPII
ncbi:21447_t:CDS:2 [Cetraspora pellucida]|uniref:21447_t:CDS:1 n=1 Tax=Cetraspora pellucida TaxID=1433469 RepID=A0A9N9G5N3_9GLOM|nr:21447_t:CDS:2 [Cetraspora pellucida]